MKFLRVNMTNQSIHIEDVPKAYEGLGGRGLTSEIVNQEVPPTCDALGRENKLVFAVGLLTGTSFVNTSRISVGAKSPLTGGIKESNGGGTIGAALGKMGIMAVIVEGQAPQNELYLLKIKASGETELVPANDYKGMRTYALVEKLFRDHGEKLGVACIGPAGEYLLASASVQTSDVDGHPCRAAARGGMGAVMGAKGLKAVIVEQGGKSGAPIANPDAFKEASRAYVQTVKGNPMSGQMFPALGTAGLVAPVNSVGAFPCLNATKGTLDGWEKISGEAMAEIIKKRGGNTTHMGCSQCIVHCSNEYLDESGKFITGSLEYETIWSMGGMTGITDLDTIARLDRLCDDIGVDTMNIGVAIAVAMDAGYKPFGDSQAAIDIMEEIASGSETGKIFGNGPVTVGRHFNHSRVPAVKNQSIAGYDPRSMPANGVTYATSPMGADHTAGNLVGEYLSGALDATKVEGHIEASRNIQPVMAFVDCTGVCLFATFSMATPEGGEAFFKAMSARQGSPFSPEDMIGMGMRCLKAERDFNRRAGLTKDADRLPRFFKDEPLPPHNTVFNISDEELDSVFDF
ncbi:MAG: aldehyde ferredoxin oxidoreductase C-terminal domain-containing protein [Desulfatiglandaceae bacterium]